MYKNLTRSTDYDQQRRGRRGQGQGGQRGHHQGCHERPPQSRHSAAHQVLNIASQVSGIASRPALYLSS